MTNTHAISPFTMPAALAAADKFISGAVWLANPSNPEQVAWLESFRRRAELASGMGEIRRDATASAADHVAWLKAEGWDAQVTQGGDRDIFLAATLNIVGQPANSDKVAFAAYCDRGCWKRPADGRI
jgi:hypothetical protein